jgi:hypothetical protein
MLQLQPATTTLSRGSGKLLLQLLLSLILCCVECRCCCHNRRLLQASQAELPQYAVVQQSVAKLCHLTCPIISAAAAAAAVGTSNLPTVVPEPLQCGTLLVLLVLVLLFC